MSYEGIACMYMSMPMAAQSLPVLGQCAVQDKKISLKFPLSTVSFEIPEAPQESRDVEFKMQGQRGEILLKITYKADLRAFVGQGLQSDQNALTFIFYKADSPLKHLKSL